MDVLITMLLFKSLYIENRRNKSGTGVVEKQ